MMANKMTEKELYTLISTIVADTDVEGVQEIIDLCERKIEQIDKKAAKAKERKASAKAEDLIKASVVAAMEAIEGPVTADMVYDAIAEETIEAQNITIAKIRNRLSQLVKEGLAERAEKKVDGKIAYSLLTNE